MKKKTKKNKTFQENHHVRNRKFNFEIVFNVKKTGIEVKQLTKMFKTSYTTKNNMQNNILSVLTNLC